MEAPLSTDAARLEAAGTPLRLRDREVGVRFTMRSMKVLEEHYGSLSALNEHVQLLVAGDHPKPHDAMTDILPAALLHESGAADELLDLPPIRYPDCLDALIDAIVRDFHSGKADEGGQGEASPGAISTTSPPSDSAGITASSGT